MLVVLGAIVGGLVAMGRFAQRRQSSVGRLKWNNKSTASIDVLSRRALGQHVSLLVIRVGERTLLVGQSAQQMTLLAELDGSDWADAEAPVRARERSNNQLLTPRLASLDGMTAVGALDAFLDRLREKTVRR